jgi:predicted ATPase
MLLILDNCEHVVEACAQLADHLIRGCPHLKILASSREALAISGETSWRIPSLALPNSKVDLEDFTALTQYEAVRLFVDRALAVLPGFSITKQNANAIVQLCQQLDGIPLALELAAARVKVMTVEQIVLRLHDRFRLLTGGSRVALPRQQTLRALIDWSYDLLNDEERQAWQAFSVFTGGWTLEAAEEVLGEAQDEPPPATAAPSLSIPTYAVLDLLNTLVSKSLVVASVEEKSGETRYALLETIRQYGTEKLRAAGLLDWVSYRHLAYYEKMAEQAEQHLQAGEQTAWLKRLDYEHDNSQAALEWALSHQEIEAALRLCIALGNFWFIRGYLSIGLGWVERVLAMVNQTTSKSLQAQALRWAGEFTRYQGDNLNGARAYYEAAVQIWRELEENKPGTAQLLDALGGLAFFEGTFSHACTFYTEALSIYRDLENKASCADMLNNVGLMIACENDGDKQLAQGYLAEALAKYREVGNKRGQGYSWLFMGFLAISENQTDQAAKLLTEAEILNQEVNDGMIAGSAAMCLGLVAQLQKDYKQAHALYRKALLAQGELQLKYIILTIFDLLAGLTVSEGNTVVAAHLFGAVEKLHEAMSAPVLGFVQQHYQAGKSIIANQRNEPTLAAAWAVGQQMSLHETLEYALKLG